MFTFGSWHWKARGIEAIERAVQFASLEAGPHTASDHIAETRVEADITPGNESGRARLPLCPRR